MTELSLDRKPIDDSEEISLLALGTVLLRSRRTVVVLGVLGAVAGLAAGLLRTRVYTSTAMFLPQVSETGTSGFAAAAGQLGIRVPNGGGSWGPAVYVELLHSRGLLEPIALDSVAVAEDRGRHVALTDLLRVNASSKGLRTERAVRALNSLVKSNEVRALGAVQLSVTTEWPSVSLWLAQRLLGAITQFNLETRKSQAKAERQFAETQAMEAEGALRAAEDRLQGFLQRNRTIGGSAELSFERDRLQRDVSLRQQVYTTLIQNREDAKIREVRDTPVITVLEEPKLPVVPESRKTVSKGILGGLLGAVIGTLIAFISHRLTDARRLPNEEVREFFKLVDEATPRFLRRIGR
jgi:uncharacterized protein involved in exopolysaccharide biosynthesis